MKQKKRGLLRLVLTAYIAATILTSLGISASAYLSTDVDLSGINPNGFVLSTSVRRSIFRSTTMTAMTIPIVSRKM